VTKYKVKLSGVVMKGKDMGKIGGLEGEAI